MCVCVCVCVRARVCIFKRAISSDNFTLFLVKYCNLFTVVLKKALFRITQQQRYHVWTISRHLTKTKDAMLRLTIP